MRNSAAKVASSLIIALDFFFVAVFSILFYLSSPVSAEPVVFVPRGSIGKIIADFSNKTPSLNDFDGFFLRFFGQPQAGYIALKREVKGVGGKFGAEFGVGNSMNLAENSQSSVNLPENSRNFVNLNSQSGVLSGENGVNLVGNSQNSGAGENSVNFDTKNKEISVNLTQNSQKNQKNSPNSVNFPAKTALSNNFVILTKADFLHKLTTAKAATTRITLIPGETTAVFFRDLASRFKLDEAALNAAYSRLAEFDEGLFYPNSFDIPILIAQDENELVKMLLRLSARAFDEFFVSEKVPQNERYKLIVKASVIQKEAAADDEMPMVSSVIDNRLARAMPLQMDGTLNYGLFSHAKITPERIRSDTSRYNTYKFSGLPPAAVCNVSFAALRAALHPAKTDYLYFMRDKSTCNAQGNACRHIFTKTMSEHAKAIDSQKNPK